MMRARELAIFGENEVYVEVDGELLEVCHMRTTDDGRLVLSLEVRR